MVKRSIDKKLRSRIFDARNERIETGQWFKNRRDQPNVERGPRESWKWKAKNSVRKEILVVSGTMKISVQNRHQRPLLSRTTDRKGWQKYFEKEESQRPESIWEIISTDAQRLHQR